MSIKTDEIPQIPKFNLPPIVNSETLLADPSIGIPPLIIEGVLHQGSKAVLGGGSKTCKTWILLDLALSVATGTLWWKWPTKRGKVLYINFEIQPGFFKNRIDVLRKQKGITDSSNLDTWNLRGKALLWAN